MEKIRADGLTRGKESTYLFPRAEHANRVSHRRVLSLSLSPSIKTFKIVETLVVLVERIARCVNGALILTKRRKSCVVTRHYPVQISPSPITW